MTGRCAGDAVHLACAADPVLAAHPTFIDPTLPASKDPTAP